MSFFTDLIEYYDWFFESYQPTCQVVDSNGRSPENEIPVIAPLFYSKVAVKNSLEIKITMNGQIADIVLHDDKSEQRKVLTPSCVYQRVNGAIGDDEFQVFTSKQRIFSEHFRPLYLALLNRWIQTDPANTSIIGAIYNAVSTVGNWSSLYDVFQTFPDKGNIIFTIAGDLIFEDNPVLYESYKTFYLTDLPNRKKYQVENKQSVLTGKECIDITDDGNRLSLGASYSNQKKLLGKSNECNVLERRNRFNIYTSPYTVNSLTYEEQYKIIAAFDQISELNKTADPNARCLPFYLGNRIAAGLSASFTDTIELLPELNSIRQHVQGQWKKNNDQYDQISICIAWWESNGNGTSGVTQYMTMTLAEYIERTSMFFSAISDFSPGINQLINIVLTSDDSSKSHYKKMKREIFTSVLEQRKLPAELINNLYSVAISPITAKNKNQIERHYGYTGENSQYYYRNAQRAAIGTMKYNKNIENGNKERIVIMLDRTERAPSYLYGRILAALHYAESNANGGERATNAEKQMSAIINSPEKITLVYERTSPYIQKLEHTKKWCYLKVQQTLQEAYSLLDNEEKKQLRKLDSDFLNGYYSQLNDFFSKAADDDKEGE